MEYLTYPFALGLRAGVDLFPLKLIYEGDGRGKIENEM